MFALAFSILFSLYVYNLYKRGLITKNRAYGSVVMIVIASFLGLLTPMIGFGPVLFLALVNAFWTPNVISNFLDDMGTPKK